LLIVLAVAALSSWIASAEHVPPVAAAPAAARPASEWIRTTAGWERRGALTPGPIIPPVNIHPGVVAGLQLTASLLALMIFPVHAVPARPPAAPAPSAAHRRRRRSAPEPSASR
jgi:hypothetical protein